MRVLLVTDWSPIRGGTEAYALGLRGWLAAAGDDVRLLTSSAGTAANGTADWVAYGTARTAPQVVLQIHNPFASDRVAEARRSFRPDVALVLHFAYHLSPAVFGALGSVPTVHYALDYKIVCPLGTKTLPDGSRCNVKAGRVCLDGGCTGLLHWLRDRPRYAMIDRALDRVDRTLACSRWLAAALEAEGHPAEPLPIPVPAPSAGYRREPDAEPRFLYVGRLSAEKGVDRLLQAFARVRREIPASRLRIVGRGPERRRLEDAAAALGVAGEVTFTGWLGPTDVEGELARAWALVAPSIWAEPLGLVAIEAIVHGVPVVASAEGGFAETVEPGVSGTLVPNGDRKALAGAMIELARGDLLPDLRVSDRAVRSTAARYGVDRHVERLRAVLSDARRRAEAGATR